MLTDVREHPKSCKTSVNKTDLNFALNHKDRVTFKRKQKDANHTFSGLWRSCYHCSRSEHSSCSLQSAFSLVSMLNTQRAPRIFNLSNFFHYLTEIALITCISGTIFNCSGQPKHLITLWQLITNNCLREDRAAVKGCSLPVQLMAQNSARTKQGAQGETS